MFTDIIKAMTLAEDKHKGQLYGSVSYYFHLLDVHKTVVEFFGEDTQAETVAFLHDILEDTDTTAEELSDYGFSDSVVRSVVLLTKREDQTREEYLVALCEDETAWRVKVADAFSNLHHSLKTLNSRRVKKYSTTLNILMENMK